MAGLPVTIRLLDPPLHEFLPPLEEATDERMRARIRALQEANPMLGTRGCRLGLMYPEIYEMQVRAIVRAAIAVRERTGDAPLVEIMHPLVGFGEELRRLRELTIAVAAEEGELDYLVGTMIELPRACIRADEIAEHADFFSFGTNDLTQTALGFSRDDAEGKFLTRYLEDGVLERNPFETLDEEGVGDLMRIAVERGRAREGRPQARHLRRARRRAALGRLLPPDRARLRVVLAVPRPARAARGGAGGARGGGRRGRRRRRLSTTRARGPSSTRSGREAADGEQRDDRGRADPGELARPRLPWVNASAVTIPPIRPPMWPPNEMFGHGEADGEVDHDQHRGSCPPSDRSPATRGSSAGAEQAEDRARRAHGDRVRVAISAPAAPASPETR